MPQNSQQWHQELSDRLERDGVVEPAVDQWTAWPFDGELTVRPLEGPVQEPARSGVDGVECFACRGAVELDSEYVVWHDDLWMVGLPEQSSTLPFAGFLMPKRHADLRELTDAESGRQGVLLTALERAIVEVLDVPRAQVSRWGDGAEHLHWWVMGRPTGVLQLRGTFLPLWGLVLPARPKEELRADALLVVDRLIELVGGQRVID